MALQECIRIIGDILKSQKLTIAEHEIVQSAFKTLVEAASKSPDGDEV